MKAPSISRYLRSQSSDSLGLAYAHQASRGLLHLLSALVFLVSSAFVADASAARVKIVQAGNELPTGGWCDVNNKDLGVGASRNYRLEGRMDTSAQTSDNGKYRIKSQGDKFEWSSGSEPSYTFTQSGGSASFGIRAKSGAALGEYTVEFAAVDSTGSESERRSCKIRIIASAGGTTSTGGTTTTTTSPQYDLKITFTAPTAMEQPVGTTQSPSPLTFTVVLENVGTAPIPSGYKIGLRRYDHTGSGMSDAVGAQQDLPTLGPCSTAPCPSQTISFIEASRPPLAGGAASRLNLYKVGITPFYTDRTAGNHIPEKGVRFVAGTGTGTGTTGGTGTTTTAAVTFSTYLAAKFKHEKCVTCHTMSDPPTGTSTGAQKRQAHIPGRFAGDTVVTNAANCSGCHSAAQGYADGWRAAESNKRWTSATSDADICTTIKTHKATAAAMKQHLKMGIPNEDVLVKWALGKMGVNHTEWNQKVDAWVDGATSATSDDMKCQ